MKILKKLAFAPLFFIVLAILIHQFGPFLKSYDFIFSLSVNTLIDLITISALISLSCFLFILFATLSSDWKLVLPVALISALIPLLFFDPSLGLVSAAAIFGSLLLTYTSLDSALASYLNFQPEALLGPAIRHLSSLLILAFCLVYFLSANKIIAQNGFQIPDSLIDTALKFASPTSLNSPNSPNTPQLSIPADQLELLKNNPDLLKQYGLDPSTLDTINQPKSTKSSSNISQDLIKQTVKDQIQNFIKPYQNFVPAGLAILLFLTVQSLASFINLLIYPLLWITFFILEKTGFVKFEVEQRPVKKLVI